MPGAPRIARTLAVPPIPNPEEPNIVARSFGSTDQADQDTIENAVVLILSRQTDQTANKTLLEANRYSCFVFDNIELLAIDLEHGRDVCACIVDGSFLDGTSSEEQIRLFQTLGEYSTFMWIRIEERHLAISRPEVLEHVRCLQRGPLSADAISIQPSGLLREQELPDLHHARDRLRTHHHTPLVFQDLQREEARVLTAAVRQYAYQQGASARAQPGPLRIRLFTSGMSGAVTVLVLGDGKQIVAKVNRKSETLDEMTRFVTYVKQWDDRLQPMVYFHGSIGVIIFSLVSELGQPEQPAPMLSDQVESLWNDEIFSPTFNRWARVEEVKQALRTTAIQLHNINHRKPPQQDHSPVDIEPGFVERLRKRGIKWNFRGDTALALSRTEERYARLKNCAIVHGDFHLKNVLVRGGRDACLIDYRAAGPGHPAIDLVRLELVLFLDFFRQVDQIGTCEELQQRLSLGASTDELREMAPSLFEPGINEACIEGCVVAREHALKAVQDHGGDNDDYLAVKYLLAWQRLLLPRTQTALARSIIDVITPLAEKW